MVKANNWIKIRASSLAGPLVRTLNQTNPEHSFPSFIPARKFYEKHRQHNASAPFSRAFWVLEKVEKNKNIQAALFVMKVMALHFVSVIFLNKFVCLLG